jgi:hypothetical protein
MIENGKYYCLNEEGRKLFGIKDNVLFMCVLVRENYDSYEYILCGLNYKHHNYYYQLNEVCSGRPTGISIKFGDGDPDFDKLQSYFIKLSEDDLIIRDIIL